jgi:2-polyprenyl-6-methoxyphenol hydroxylase-like FAD-dependent oxidoreductase
MKVACIGGGPGGLFFADLLKRGCPDADVTVFERNRPGDTFGFGVVFSDPALGVLDDVDPSLRRALAGHGRHWDEIEVRIRGTSERCGGNGMAAVPRATLLRLLQSSARAAGVRVCFQHEVRDPEELAGFDLVVVCDGAHSRFRDLFAADFCCSGRTAGAKFIWFGTTHMFGQLTFVHRDGPHGIFAAHAYPVDDGISTFIVETDEKSWTAAGLDTCDRSAHERSSDERSRAYLEDLFGPDIAGQRLVANNSRWANFVTRGARNWRRGRWVLLGDAAHTVHFSVGSGTRMALEDAGALAREVLASPRDIPAALEAYESARQLAVEKIQQAAAPSLSWWENFGRYVRAFEPQQFAFHFLTRSLPRSKLELRDPGFVARVDHWWRERHGSSPLQTGFRAGPVQLPMRYLSADAPAIAADSCARSCAWIDAPADQAAMAAASDDVRTAVRAGAPIIGIRGGTPLTRVLLAEEARLTHRAAALVSGPYGADAAETMILSGRTDLVLATGDGRDG